jgi:2-keto-4-pentenoate hydratase/2-oxohepta-3-ene-1,7-dioic acid hydratase in catechol pathway
VPDPLPPHVGIHLTRSWLRRHRRSSLVVEAEYRLSDTAWCEENKVTAIVRVHIRNGIAYGHLVDDSVFELVGDPGGRFRAGSLLGAFGEMQVLPPCIPGKIIGVGLNYRAHIDERGIAVPTEPLIFLKPPSSVIGPGDEIILPTQSGNVACEAELAIVMQRRASRISPSESRDYVLGYTCANDVTAVDLARADLTPTRAKSFDTFCPIGPCIATDIEPEDLCVRSYLNGSLQQEASTAEMVFSVGDIVSFVSGVMTLEPWDVILTGTPARSPAVTDGDIVEIEIQGIGVLRNPVVRRATNLQLS